MLVGDLPPTATDKQPVFGKDHINLADWPIGVLTHQVPVDERGRKEGVKTYAIHRSDRLKQIVQIEGGAQTGLPVPADDDVLIALMSLGALENFETDIVTFTVYPLLRFMRWPQNSHYAARLKRSLERLTKLNITYEGIWYDRHTRRVESTKFTGIIADAKLTFRTGSRKPDDEPDCYVQWTKTFHESLKHGNLLTINLDLLFSWKRPCAKHLHRHLNKVWYAGRKFRPYERDLIEIACGHLGMAHNKDLKRNFDLVYQELVDRNFLQPIPKSLRYEKIRKGVWRVRFALHPDHCRTKDAVARKSSCSPATAAHDHAADLVRAYHRHRFGRGDHVPTRRELEHAEALLRKSDADTLLAIVPDVAKRVGESSQHDLHFGFALPFFQTALEHRQQKEVDRGKRHQKRARDVSTEEKVAAEKRRRDQRRSMLLTRWQKLSAHERHHYLTAAINNASSVFDRRRLSRASPADPPIEALELLTENSRSPANHS